MSGLDPSNLKKREALLNHLPEAAIRRKKLKLIFSFQLVAWAGTLVNLGALWLLKGFLDVPLVLAGACAIELAIIHNFTWHYFFTWKDRVGRTVGDYLFRLLKYNLITASIDFFVNLGVLFALTKYAGVHYLLSDIAGMIAGPVFKFIANEYLIFKKGENLEKGWEEKR